MARPGAKLILVLGGGLVLLTPAWPSAAQGVGYVTGFPGKDPAGDDEIGWGPAYRPETSFSQPGTPPTPGDIAGAAYRARTGHGPYETVQGTGGADPVENQTGRRSPPASPRVHREPRASTHGAKRPMHAGLPVSRTARR